MKSLQYQFIDSKGGALDIAGVGVTQRDRIPVKAGVVTVRFISTRPEGPVQGVQLYAGKEGKIAMSDGSVTERLDIWRRPNLPDTVSHRVFCPDGFLSVNNRYEVQFKDGHVVGEHWTNNAGMTVQRSDGACRRYGCSDGIGDFCGDDLVFELEWKDQAE